MAAKDQPKESRAAASDNPSTVNVEDVVRPFQDASSKFLQANLAAQESAIKQRAKAWLDYHDEARQVEQEAYRAVMDATRKSIDQLGQQATGSIEQVYAARVQAQAEYEKEVKRVCADVQAKLTAVARKAFDESGNADAARQFATQRQEVYQAYLSDLQQAWSGTTALDPQTVNAIASHISSTINSVS